MNRAWLIPIALLLAFIAFGLLGKVATSGYKCHYVRVGDSQVCE